MHIPNCQHREKALTVQANSKISYHPLPSGLFRDNLQHWLGDFARLLNVQLHYFSNEGMSNDAAIHECESKIEVLHRALRALLFTKCVWVL